jgi:hypothetical protein
MKWLSLSQGAVSYAQARVMKRYWQTQADAGPVIVEDFGRIHHLTTTAPLLGAIIAGITTPDIAPSVGWGK